jgi:hypothetical protein
VTGSIVAVPAAADVISVPKSMLVFLISESGFRMMASACDWLGGVTANSGAGAASSSAAEVHGKRILSRFMSERRLLS